MVVLGLRGAALHLSPLVHLAVKVCQVMETKTGRDEASNPEGFCPPQVGFPSLRCWKSYEFSLWEEKPAAGSDPSAAALRPTPSPFCSE